MTAEGKGHPKLRLFWKILSISFGSLLILVGIAGLFLPILQGWLMILAGLAILSPHSERARAIMSWLKRKLHIGRRHKAEAGGEAPGGPATHKGAEDRRASM